MILGAGKTPENTVPLSTQRTKLEEEANFLGRKKIHKKPGSSRLSRAKTIITGFTQSLGSRLKEVGKAPHNLSQSLKAQRKEGAKAQASQAPQRVTLNAGNAGIFELNSVCFPPSDTMDADSIEKGVAQKIQDGHKLAQSIIQGKTVPDTCSMKDVTDLAWFFYATAEKQAGSFSSGAITLEDPDNRLAQFLDKSDAMYQRISTHREDMQKEEGGAHRGIDNNKDRVSNPDDFNAILPHQRRTILYGPIKEGATGGQMRPFATGMLYMKMEGYGAALFGPKDKKSSQGVKPSRKRNVEDISNSVGHSTRFFVSTAKKVTGAIHAGTSRRENVPSDVKQAYDVLIQTAKTLSPEAEKLLRAHNATQSNTAAIRTMDANISDVKVWMSTPEAAKMSPKEKGEINAALKAFEAVLAQKQYNSSSLHLRFGNEVILQKKDLFG